MIERDGELTALFVMDLSLSAARLRFVERKRQCDVLRGAVTIIALDVATNYCQASGRRSLRLEPKNGELAAYYERLGFTPVPRDEKWYELALVRRP